MAGDSSATTRPIGEVLGSEAPLWAYPTPVLETHALWEAAVNATGHCGTHSLLSGHVHLAYVLRQRNGNPWAKLTALRERDELGFGLV